jgi:hypothetical protein
MMRNFICVGLGILFVTSLGMARERKGPITGTWDCQLHGGAQGDMAFTLFLQQDKEIVDGSFSSPMGGTQISSGAFKRNLLEIHIDTPQGSYTLMAKFSKGALSGSWTSDTEKGIWEGKKQGGGSK